MAKLLDDLLLSLGTGKWNILTFIAVAFWFNVIVYHALAGAFLAPAVEHTCIVPSGGQPKVTLLGHGGNGTQIDQCHYVPAGSPNATVPCQEWEFDNSTFGVTMTSQFDLVCDRAYLRSIYQSTYMMGSFIAAPVGGILADKYGRKFIFTIGAILYFAMSIISCWLPNMAAILAFRFLLGLMHTPALNAGYILGMEVCTPSLRSVVGVLVALPWAFGTILWGGFAYLIPDWRWLQFTVSMPTIMLLPALWYMDESPRWLAVRGEHDRALRIFRRASRWNGTTLPPDQEIRRIMKLTQNQETSAPEERKVINGNKFQFVLVKLKKCAFELFILFMTPRLRMITLIIWMDFLLASTVFYGLSLNAVNFSANPYIYMMINGCVEIPAYLFIPLIAGRLGRKVPTVAGFCICSVCLLVLPFIDKDNLSWLIMVLAMAGKLSMSASFQLLYLYSAELFPTEIRLQGFGSGIFVSRIGGMLAPFITDLLGSVYSWSPSVVFGVLSFIGGSITLILPETLKRPMPDTIADLENPSFRNRKPRYSDADVLEMDKLTPDN